MCMAGPIARGVSVGISNVSVMLQRVRLLLPGRVTHFQHVVLCGACRSASLGLEAQASLL